MFDISIDGVGYMLAGGTGKSYTRSADRGAVGLVGSSETLVGAVDTGAVMHRLYWDRWTGSGRAFISRNERGYDGKVALLDRLRPVEGGDALALVPGAYTLPTSGTNASNSYLSITYKGRTYVAMDKTLYLINGAVSGVITGLSVALTFSDTITHLALTDNTALMRICANTMYTWDGAAGSPTSTGVAAVFAVELNGYIVRATEAGTLVANVGSYVPERYLGYSVSSLIVYAGAVWVGTDGGLFRATLDVPINSSGAIASINFEVRPILNASGVTPESNVPQQRNFYAMTEAHGSLWYWAMGRVWRGRWSGTQFDTQPQPLYGRNRGLGLCSGLVVWAGVEDSGSALWTWDSATEGWFKLAVAGSGTTYTMPFAASTRHADGGLVAFAQGTLNLVRWPLDISRSAGRHPNNFGLSDVSVTGTLQLPLITAEDLAREAGAGGAKCVQALLYRVGVEWGISGDPLNWPPFDDYAAADSIGFRARISTNGGASWQNLNNVAGNSFYSPDAGDYYGGKTDWQLTSAQRTAVAPIANIGQTFTGLGKAAGWLLQLQMSGPHAPLLRRVWLDYRVQPLSATTGQSWKMELAIEDGLTGALDASGLPIAPQSPAALANLWSLWSSGRTVNFTDLNSTGPYSVKVTSLDQRRLTTSGPGWLVSLDLTEAIE